MLILNPSCSSNIVTVLASTLSCCLLLRLCLMVPERRCFYCSILKTEAGAFPSCLAVDVFFHSILFLADWLEGIMVFETHSCLSVCYIFANEYTYKWVFKGAWSWLSCFVSLYTDLQTVVISETSCIVMYITWAQMWVSLDGLTGIRIFFFYLFLKMYIYNWRLGYLIIYN